MNSRLHSWTDGSCMFNCFALHAAGSFAVIDCQGNTKHTGLVHHFALSPYSCELWAMINAFALSPSPLHNHSDSESVCKQAKFVIKTGNVPMTWSHFIWWKFFADLLAYRKQFHSCPFEISWCPAHVMEDIPISSITEAMAMAHSTTKTNIWLNRVADQVAKQTLLRALDVFHASWETLRNTIFAHQKRLCYISIEVTRLRKCHEKSEPSNAVVDNEQNNISIHPYDLTVNHTAADFAHVLPRWEWFPTHSEYTWKAKIKDPSMPKQIAFTSRDWSTCVSFFKA